MNYIEVKIKVTPCSETSTDLLSAFLGEIGFDSFVPFEEGLLAHCLLLQLKKCFLPKQTKHLPLRLSPRRGCPIKRNILNNYNKVRKFSQV